MENEREPEALADARRTAPHAVLSWKDMAPALTVCVIVLCAGLFTGFRQEEPDSDEPVYLAMARAWARDGERPYADFFLAHPPLLIAPAAALFRVLPPSIRLARVVPVLSTLALFALVLAAARRVERTEGLPGAAMFAATLFACSPVVHLVGATYLGMFMCTALCFCGFELASSDRRFPAGLLAGLSLCVRFSCAPAVAVLAVSNMFRPRFLAGFALGLCPLLALVLLAPGFFDQAFLYHFGKSSVPAADRFASFVSLAWEEKAIFLLFALAFLRPGGRSLRLPAAAGAACLLFMFAQPVVWPYYFVPALPFLCVAASAALASVLKGRIPAPALALANVALLAAAGGLSAFIVIPRYKHDRTLEPLVEKAVSLVPARGTILDLSGGGKGCYVACKTGLRMASGRYDMNLSLLSSGRITPDSIAFDISRGPDLVFTEMEAQGRTNAFSRLPQARRALLGTDRDVGGYRPADFLLRANDLSLVVIWTPLPGEPARQPPQFDGEDDRDFDVWYVTSGLQRDSRRKTVKATAGFGDPSAPELALELESGPGVLLARGAFAPPGPAESRWRSDDSKDDRLIVSYSWSVPGNRVFVETSFSGRAFEPLSFTEAEFDPVSGELGFMRVYSEVGRGFVPVMTVQRKAGP